MQGFDEDRFRRQVDAALNKVRTILENTRSLEYAADVGHQYDDKYLLAEFLTNSTIAALLNCLEALGVDEAKLKKMVGLAKTRSVTLSLGSHEKCAYVREETKKVQSATEYVREVSGPLGTTTKTDKTFTTVTEFFWDFTVEYELIAYLGNMQEKIVLQSRKGQFEVVTSTKSSPKPESSVKPAIEVNITWLLSYISEELALKFNINRANKKCRTPRRNPEVADGLSFFQNLFNWGSRVHSYFMHNLFPVQTNHGLDLSKMNDNGLFIPVLPLFEDSRPANITSASSAKALAVLSYSTTKHVLPVGDVGNFLGEQKRTMTEKFDEFAKMYTDTKKLITAADAKLVATALHVRQICQHWNDGVDYIESMLRKQLIAAIGKEVSPVDFANYMKFHDRQLFKPEYEPRQFSFAVRRPDHYPEGSISIEGQLADGSIPEPIQTSVNSSAAIRPMSFTLDAATKVSLMGERHVHAFVMHQFEGVNSTTFSLIARSRQFSSFILLVGTVISKDLFEPKYACIIQNKDELKIPLMFEQIPTPKEFRDAIESLSPEQQRFCKAIRSMQLASTLFAVCVIQIKPQLEKLLKLPDDSLTKEIQLTQDLMELFMKYQIPSDLISFGGPETATSAVKVDTVKKQVKKMQDMIQNQKEKQIKEKTEEVLYKALEVNNESAALPVFNTFSAMPSAPGGAFFGGGTFLGLAAGAGGGGGGGAPGGGGPGSGLGRGGAPAVGGRGAPTNASVVTRSSALAPPSAPQTTASPAPTTVTTTKQAPQTTQPQQPQQPTAKTTSLTKKDEFEDYTKLPTILDGKFEKLDEDSALRPTIIKVGGSWKKKSQKSLLAEPADSTLSNDEQETERNKAFDLLDGLSRSGNLTFDHASFHVILASTHCFDKSVMNTIIQDNVNPIEKVERSTLIVSTTVHNKEANQLVKDDQKTRVSTYSPALFALPAPSSSSSSADSLTKPTAEAVPVKS